MAEVALFQLGTSVTFGPGALAGIGPAARELGLGKALIVTDPGVKAAGITGRVSQALASADIESVVFDAVEPNPSLETAEKAAARYRETGCSGIVAVGGGSPMDAAKGAGVLLANPGGLVAYVGVDKVAQPLPPLIAVPTTVGTGSEVTRFAVLTNTSQRRKLVLASARLMPHVALLDPELVYGLPAGLVAATGMDALTHAIESIISVFASPFSDALGLEAIHMIARHLPPAVHSADREARASLLYASALAGMAFNSARTGLVHGMSHPLSSYYGVPHGMANAILLPYVLAFNAPTCEAGLARIAQAMGQPARPQAAIEAVRRLSAEVGIPDKLSQVQVDETFIPNMSQDAFESGNAQVINPRKPTLAEVIELYQQAL